MGRSFKDIVGEIGDRLGNAVSAAMETPGGVLNIGGKLVNGVMGFLGATKTGSPDPGGTKDPDPVLPDPSLDGHDNSTDIDNDQRNDNNQNQGSSSGTSQDGKNNASGAQSSIMAVNTSTESTIEQQSSASAQNSVSQVLTAQTDANAQSDQRFSADAHGASVVVSPVLSVSMDDTYSTDAVSEYSPDDHSAAPNWLLVAAATAGASYLAYRWFHDKEE